MYLTCLNLPRSIRNLGENMIFVGLVPGGNGEASLEHLNHYLQPLVDELLILKDGRVALIWKSSIYFYELFWDDHFRLVLQDAKKKFVNN